MTQTLLRQITCILFVLSFLNGASVKAQDTRPSLPIIADPRGEAEKCGITKPAMEAEATRVLRNNGIRAGGNSAPWLYINTNVLLIFGGTHCIVVTTVQIQSNQTNMTIGAYRKARGGAGSLQLCDSGMVQSWPLGNVGGKVDIETPLHRCLGELEY